MGWGEILGLRDGGGSGDQTPRVNRGLTLARDEGPFVCLRCRTAPAEINYLGRKGPTHFPRALPIGLSGGPGRIIHPPRGAGGIGESGE